jgi:hypothetical protein
MLTNPNFYPTPPLLASRMISKLKGRPKKVLEPSAGKGDIVRAVVSRFSHTSQPEVSCIEIDPVLQATLRGDGHRLIDTDFLAYSGQDKFDAIIANPPFDSGDLHLLKAIEIMYRGEIVFLLNAETLRNPHTNTRKLLVRKLDELGASVEYLPNQFAGAERKTGVEVALIHIVIDQSVSDDLFAGADDFSARCTEKVEEKHELSTGRTLEELVADYNEVVRVGTETVVAFYRNFKKVGGFLRMTDAVEKLRISSSSDVTGMMQDAVNKLLIDVRACFWRKTLDLKEVRNRLTTKKAAEFEHALADRCYMDFTESNVRTFVLNLMDSYEQTLTDAIVDIFDMFTVRHCYGESGVHEKNVHYFNGWKTNKSFKVGRRVVVPIRGGYCGNAFFEYGRWQLSWQAKDQLRDIDLVASYFSGLRDYLSMSQALMDAFSAGPKADRHSGIEAAHFTVTAHKKGTIHITFNDEDVLRRFNFIACRGKGWLPCDYGKKRYQELSDPERAVVDAFEGERSYTAALGRPVFAPSALLQIAA